MKKILITLMLVFSLSVACLTGCSLTLGGDPEDSAAAVYTMDVNPGVRIFVDAEGNVISVEATNADGEAIVAELTYKGESFETVTEKIIDALSEAGYLEGEESSVLISLEKAEIEISERLNEKINEAFEKHGKVASVIEQSLNELDEEMKKEIESIAAEHHVSKGKAHLIERIGEEFPELSEEELAALNINELRMLLEDTTDEVKKHFDKLGEIVKSEYMSRQEAMLAALASLELDIDFTNLEQLPMIKLRATNRDGRMLYSVEVIYDGSRYELLIDAASGEIVTSESGEHVEFDPEAALGEFFDKHNVNAGSLKEYFGDLVKPENEQKELSRGEILDLVLTRLGIDEDSIERTEVDVHRGDTDVVVRVEILTENGCYELVLEAFSGVILKAELNGEPIATETEDAAV